MAAALVVGIVVLLSATALASRGDRTLLYHRCIEAHRYNNCSLDGKDTFLPHAGSKAWLGWFGWSCTDNCRYECMWITVQAFHDDALPVPQFHGKWPFVRLFGIQEPASAIASLLNFGAHLVMTRQFLREVPCSAPLFKTWLLYSVFSLIAWLSSTIFHTKDTSITEKMDYFGALSYMLCSFYACIARIHLGLKKKNPPLFVPFVLAAFFVAHVSYLSFVKFDYKYNLIVNVGIGAISSVLWISWCLPRCHHQHNVFGLTTILALNALVSLELLDFAPFFWTFDAHALWHMGTIVLAVPWYRFIINDSLLLSETSKDVHLHKA